MSDHDAFLKQRQQNIRKLKAHTELQTKGIDFLVESCRLNYSYNFDWLGLPIIQFPQDMVAIQEIIWRTKPTVIIETGVARGGSLMLSASILHLLNGPGKVIGVDIDIRPHNRAVIESHPLAHRIKLIEGSSIDPTTYNTIQAHIKPSDQVMVILDSNHTHQHVQQELRLYAPLVKKGFYLVVMDSVIEDMPADFFPDRPWGHGNNPKSAVHDFLNVSKRFVIDEEIQHKLLISVAPDGYLRCIEDQP